MRAVSRALAMTATASDTSAHVQHGMCMNRNANASDSEQPIAESSVGRAYCMQAFPDKRNL